MEFDMTRKHYEKIDYKPLIFFAIFDVSDGEFKITKEKHHVYGIPEGIEIQMFRRPDDDEYFKGFFGGSLGLVLYDSNKELYDKASEANNCVVVRGNVEDDTSFEYLRDVIGIVEAFAENGAIAVLDLLNMTFISPTEWRNMYFEQEINPVKHVNIFVSDDEEGTYWYHTRGLIKFGRPELSMHKIKREDIDKVKEIFDMLIEYEGHGVFFKEEVKVVTPENETYIIKTDFINDFENPDFNNAYYNLEIKEVIK